MALTTAIPTRSGSDQVESTFHNTYFVTGLSDVLRATGMFTDVARTVTAVITYSTAPVFSTAITIANTLTITTGGIAVTGNSTITGTLGSLTGITSSGTAALATVTVSTALTVSATATMRAIAFAADSTYVIGTTSVRPATIYADIVNATGVQTSALLMNGDITTSGGGDIGKTGARFASGWFTGTVTANSLRASPTGLVTIPGGGDTASALSLWIEGDELHWVDATQTEYIATGVAA